MDAAALQFGDWLSIIDSLMGDLSYSSGDWWALVRGAVDQGYRDWLNVGPPKWILGFNFGPELKEGLCPCCWDLFLIQFKKKSYQLES